MKKILLVYPPTNNESIIHGRGWLMEPLALEYIAAALPDREVKILDMRIDNKYEEVIREFKPDVVGFTGYSVHVNNVIKLAKKTKDINVAIRTIVGGHHATVSPKDFDTPEIDFIVRGEGCGVISDLICTKKEIDKIMGLAYLVNGKRIFSEIRECNDLDSLPLPNRSLTVNYHSKYLYNYDRCTLVRTSVGCPYRCVFCSLWEINGGKHVTRSPKQVLEEMQSIKNDFIFFADDESMIDYKRMYELADLIEQAGIKKKYWLYSRADTVVRTPDLFKKWREIGLERVCVGFETFDDKNLKMMNKHISTDIQRKAIDILGRLGITIEATLIINPDYTIEDFKRMKTFIRDNNFVSPSLAILTPLPGSKYWDEKKDQIITNNWDLWDCTHTVLKTFLGEKNFYRQYNWLCLTYMPLLERLKHFVREPIRKTYLRLEDGFRNILKIAKNAI